MIKLILKVAIAIIVISVAIIFFIMSMILLLAFIFGPYRVADFIGIY